MKDEFDDRCEWAEANMQKVASCSCVVVVLLLALVLTVIVWVAI